MGTQKAIDTLDANLKVIGGSLVDKVKVCCAACCVAKSAWRDGCQACRGIASKLSLTIYCYAVPACAGPRACVPKHTEPRQHQDKAGRRTRTSGCASAKHSFQIKYSSRLAYLLR